MAIALDNHQDFGVGGPGTGPLNLGAFITAGSNRILFVGVAGSGTYADVGGVTYGGVSMTEASHTTTASGQFVYLFYLIAPTLGSNNIVVTTTASISVGVTAVSYTGALQSGQPDATGLGGNNNSTEEISVTVVKSGCWITGYIKTNTNPGVLTPFNSTFRDSGNPNTSGVSFDSNAVVSTGSNTIGFTSGSSVQWGGVVASFAPIPSGGAILTTHPKFWGSA